MVSLPNKIILDFLKRGVSVEDVSTLSSLVGLNVGMHSRLLIVRLGNLL
jgi:hypothetical protein